MSFQHAQESERRLDHATAHALLAGALPAERHQRLIPLGEGDFCIAFREQTRVLRVAKHAEAAIALRVEACVLTRVADLLPLPVPRPVFRDPDGGLPYSVHEEVIGDPLTEERWLGMLPREKNRVAAELGGFLTALHSLPIEAVRQCGVRSLGQAQLARRLRSTAPETIYRLLDPESRQRLGDLLERCSTTDARDLVPALVHGDVAPGHVLFDPVHNQLTGIIDFGDLVLADPARDFIYIYEDFGQEFLAVVLSFYRREASATLLPRIRDWYLLEAVSWTVQMCEEQHRAKTGQGIREIVRELATE